jgi:rod shape determining protein RodA
MDSVLLQPNLSMSLVILVLWFSRMWVSGLPAKYLGLLVLLGLLGISPVSGIACYWNRGPFIQDYSLSACELPFPRS